MPRGMLTDEIKEFAEKFLGREFDITELRLYPYLDYCLKNGGKYESKRVNWEEEKIMMQLAFECRMKVEENSFSVTKSFYDFIQEVLWMSYVEDKLILEDEINNQNIIKLGKTKNE